MLHSETLTSLPILKYAFWLSAEHLAVRAKSRVRELSDLSSICIHAEKSRLVTVLRKACEQDVTVGAGGDEVSGSYLAGIEALYASRWSIDRSDTRASNRIEQTVVRGPGEGARRHSERQYRNRIAAIRSI